MMNSQQRLFSVMHRAHYVLLWGLCLGWLVGCAPVAPLPEPVTPSVTPTATFTPLPPTWTPAPTLTATPTPLPPTPDPLALRTLAQRGEARIRAAAGAAEVVCFRYEDTDGDGTPEWLALTHQEAEPYHRLRAFILDDNDAFYALETVIPDPETPDYGLGQYATCEVEIRDVNADGRVEIAIFGHAAQNKTLLHVYVWEDGVYRVLGGWHGNAGIFFADTDGALSEEIIEGHRDNGAPDFSWQTVFTWDGKTYGWTTDRWAWYFLDRPHAYITHKPEYAVISFYLALADRDLPGAYALLAPQAQPDYTGWALGFATTVHVEVGSVRRVPGVGDDTHARVAAMVVALDNEGRRIVARLWEVAWNLELTPGGWRLASGTTNLLDSWEANYWK